MLKSNLIKVFERLIDLTIVFGSILVYGILVFYMDNGYLPQIFDKLVETMYSIMSYSLYLFIVFILFRIYSPSVFERNFLSSMKSIALSLVLSNIVLMILTFFFGSQMLFNPVGVIGVILIQLTIFTIYKYFAHKYLSRLIQSSIMIIGSPEEANELAKEFFKDNDHNKFVSAIIYERDGILPVETLDIMKEVAEVFICPNLNDSNKQSIMLHAIAHLAKDVHIVPKTYEISLINSKDESIDDTLLLHIPMMRLTPEQRFIKRTFDILVSGILLFLLSPILLTAAILIKLEDKGPIFFKQTRYKRNNATFQVLKFRSMNVIQTPEQLNKRPSKDDNRITKIGKIIRAIRLDELPQLINVLKGDMSLVGPRPLVLDEIDAATKIIPEFYYRSNVKPGLTGLAQVKGKYDTKDKEKIRYDLLYVKKSNFWFDLKILILTIKVIFTKGSVTEEEQNQTLVQVLDQQGLIYTENQHYMRISK